MKVSRVKVENVVYAPRNPIVRKLRHPPGTRAVSNSSARNPMANEPVTLLMKVPQGKEVPVC